MTWRMSDLVLAGLATLESNAAHTSCISTRLRAASWTILDGNLGFHDDAFHCSPCHCRFGLRLPAGGCTKGRIPARSPADPLGRVFPCHGPDKSTRMVNLRLDIKDGAFATRKMGRVIVPGKLEKSLLYQRISATDTRKMPPRVFTQEAHPQQIDTLRRWIDEGADWKEHWAYPAPMRSAEPVVTQTGWCGGSNRQVRPAPNWKTRG